MPARLTKLQRDGDTRRVEAARAIKDPRRRLLKVIELLEANLGTPRWDGRKNALEVLVLTILSQNTTDPNALRAYRNLAERCPAAVPAERNGTLPMDEHGNVDKVRIRLSDAANAVAPPDWPRVAAMKPPELAELIRAAGLPASKSASILAALAWLKETVGAYDLDAAIETLGADGATEALSGLKGIGVKTVSVTLIEALGADLCPVDTHVHRVINRLGIVDTKADRDRTFRQLKPMIPPGRAFGLHHNLLTLGRTLCAARNPKCGECFLRRLCPSDYSKSVR
jgi:endonuclease III